MKRALITGVTGQDGSYLAELLLQKGYEVHGIVRRASTITTGRIDHLFQDPHESSVQLRLHYGDLTDASSLRHIIDTVQPDEVYNLAAQSHVRVSFDMPLFTADVDAMGTMRMLEAIRDCQERNGKQIRFYQASSSEMFGKVHETPQKETTPFHPRSPYGVSKVFSYWSVVNYREAYGQYACNGILFNHESPRRGETFVTRIALGNLDARRDWGFAGDYVEAMWLMLQQDTPEDFVVSTGETHSVQEFLEVAFGRVGLDYQKYVEIDPRYYRPAEVDLLLGDATKAREVLNWKPKVGFEELAFMMVDTDLEKAAREKTLADAGFQIHDGQKRAA